jgi:hypothetical protein
MFYDATEIVHRKLYLIGKCIVKSPVFWPRAVQSWRQVSLVQKRLGSGFSRILQSNQ